MTYWLASGIICGVVGYWLAAKYQLNRRLGLTVGFGLSSFFTVGLWRLTLAYDAPTQVLLILFALLACITTLTLVEKRKIIGLVKLIALTFSFSVLFHQLIPDAGELNHKQRLLTQFVPTIQGLNLSSPFLVTEVKASSLIGSLPDGVTAIARITGQTPLLEEREGTLFASQHSVDEDVWVAVESEPIEIDNEQYVRVRLHNQEGSGPDSIRYVPESSVGLRVLIPLNEGN